MTQKSSDTVKYVLTANTSKSSGLRKLGHICMVFGYGNSQYASHGRPRWKIGYVPAQMTAKMVIASAKRLIEVRHSCRSRRRTAEISVPAWPMPIHHTKFTMSKPQPTGWLTPQSPMPRTTRFPSAQSSSIISENETMNAASRYLLVPLVWTMAAILSVTVPSVWPGWITGTSPRDGGGGVASSAGSLTLGSRRTWLSPSPGSWGSRPSDPGWGSTATPGRSSSAWC